MADQSETPPEKKPSQARAAVEQRTIEESAERAVSNGTFKSPRDQYVYSEKELSDDALARAWDCSGPTIARNRAKDLKKGFDWKQQRQQFWRRLSTSVGQAIEKNTLEDVSTSATSHRSMIRRVTDRLDNPFLDEALEDMAGDNPKEYLNCMKILAGTVKICADVEEKLTGGKMLQESFDQRMKDMDWFAEVVLSEVRDPAIIEKIVRALQRRRSLQQIVAVEDWSEQIAYARGVPSEDVLEQTETQIKRITGGEDE